MCFDNRQGITLDVTSAPKHSVVQSRMNVAQEDLAVKRTMNVADIQTGRISFFRARDAAPNEDQEATRMNRAAA